MSTIDEEPAAESAWTDCGPGPMNGVSGQRLSDMLVRLVQDQLRTPASICDLGCGNGFLASRLGRLGHRVVGVDASEHLLNIAESNYRAEGVRFQQGRFGPLLSAAIAERPFDCVVSVDVIEHLYRPLTLLETADQILRPGGRLLMCTPYHGYLKNVAISALGKWDSHHTVNWDGGHIKFFSPATLAAAVQPLFQVDGFAYYGRLPYLWKNMICLATKRA